MFCYLQKRREHDVPSEWCISGNTNLVNSSEHGYTVYTMLVGRGVGGMGGLTVQPIRDLASVVTLNESQTSACLCGILIRCADR